MGEDAKIEQLKRRISALLAKSSGTDNPHEADAFAAKARELMDEHCLSLDDVDQNPLGQTSILMPYSDRMYIWVASTGAEYLGAVAAFQKFGAFNSRGHWTTKMRVNLYGRESARVTASLMVPWWWEQCVASGNRLYRRGVGSSRHDAIRQVMTMFARRLHHATQERADPALAEATAHRGEMAEAKISKRGKTGITLAAYDEAERIAIHQQVGGK